MKVIKDNYKKFPIEVTCANCGSIIEIENQQDLCHQQGDFHSWYCPLCTAYNEDEFEL